MYPPDLYPPAWSGPVYPPSTLYPLAGSRSVTGYIKPQKDLRRVYQTDGDDSYMEESAPRDGGDGDVTYTSFVLK